MSEPLRNANDFISRFDRDGDGLIDRSEGEDMARALAKQAVFLGAEETVEEQEVRGLRSPRVRAQRCFSNGNSLIELLIVLFVF